ncbi:MAG: ADP-ribosylglycohydrolase family protein [Anaerolineae bacterium]|nr:ADP-ribosylglycohydrolase family protein [Anaerolineae bacterium]
MPVIAAPALDRAAGMLAGVAIGDALGMPAEFLTPEHIREWYGGITHLIAANANHPHHKLPPGAVTDDTDHTMLLAQLLIDHHEIDPHEFARRLLEWGQSPRVQANRFVGPSTLKTLAALEAGKPLTEVPRAGTSVGAAMRVVPLAIAFPNRDKLVEQVVASCAVSHYTRTAVSGAMAMAFALSASLEPGADIHSIGSAAKAGAVTGRNYGDWTWTPLIEKRIDYVLDWVRSLSKDAVLSRLYELIGVDMYAEQLLPCAVGLAGLADGDPQQAMLWAANLGGDSDTLASMTGALCGGWRGLSAINREWLEQVETVNGLDVSATAEKLVVMRRKWQEQE